MKYQISWSKDSSRFQLEKGGVFKKNRVEYPNEIGGKMENNGEKKGGGRKIQKYGK